MHATRQKHQNLALFDFDGTLCRQDSFSRFFFEVLTKREILLRGIKLLPWLVAYIVHAYPAAKMRPRVFCALLQHHNAANIQEQAHRYAQHLLSQLNPQLLQQLHAHQARGDRVVLVSASLNLYLAPFCQALNIELLCTEVEIQDHTLTGHYASPDCSGPEKQARVLANYCLSDYAKIYAYGNSAEDHELLSLAHYPFMCGQDHTLPNLR